MYCDEDTAKGCRVESSVWQKSAEKDSDDEDTAEGLQNQRLVRKRAGLYRAGKIESMWMQRAGATT